MNAHADVDDAMANGIRSRHREGSRRRLHESNDVALGILHMKPQAAVRAVFDTSGHVDLVRGEVVAKRLGIGGDVSQMVETVGPGSGRQRQNLDKLRRIHIIADAVRDSRDRGP